jgi:hypothetical protein
VCTNGAEVRNMGNVRLSDVTIKGSVNCSKAAGELLDPGASLKCTVSGPGIGHWAAAVAQSIGQGAGACGTARAP